MESQTCLLSLPSFHHLPISTLSKPHHIPLFKTLSSTLSYRFRHFHKSSSLHPSVLQSPAKEKQEEEQVSKLRWPKVEPTMTESQKLAISKLPPKMTKRCKALLQRIICLSPQGEALSHLLYLWVMIMKPRRADWLSVLREMARMENPLYLEVAELALVEESFEADVRDYTKLIDAYAKQNRLEDAQNTLEAMKKSGLTCDQVTLTVLVQMYSKAGDLTLAEKTFEEIKLLGLPLDKRAYGSMIMAYIRAGLPKQGECVLREMEAQDLYAGKEVYKALLRAYSTEGDTDGAERVFKAIQLAAIVPDVKHCAQLMKAYCNAGQSEKACLVLQNLRNARLEPSDKCIALMLAAYEKECNLNKALGLLLDLEKDGVVVGKEGSEVLAKWFSKLGVVNEVERILKEYSAKAVRPKVRS